MARRPRATRSGAVVTAAERLLIGRYLWPGRAGRAASLVAAIGCAGVAIGVASLLLVLAVMNGAEARLAVQIGGADGQVAISRPGGDLANWRDIAGVAAHAPGALAVTPSLTADGLATVAGRVEAAELRGLRPADLTHAPGRLVDGRAPVGEGEALIGSGLARRLGVMAGDALAIGTVVPDAESGVRPVTRAMRVAGVFETGLAEVDDRRVLLSIHGLRELAGRPETIDRLDLRLAKPEQAAAAAAQLRRRVPKGVLVRTWEQMNAALVTAQRQERVAMTAITAMVTLIALSNVLSSLVMLVRFKRREIAMLRTMGLTRAGVASVFVTVGTAIGASGGLAGLALGGVLIAGKDRLVAAIVRLTGAASPELDVFLSLPLLVTRAEVAGILLAVGLGAVLSTLYPAIRAAAVDPVQALRLE